MKDTRRSGRSGVLRRCGIAMAEQLTGGGRGLNSGAVVARIGARELGEVPGNGARLLHGSGKPGVWRSSEATAAQGRSAQRSCASAADLGFGALVAALERWGSDEGRGPYL